MSETIKAMSTLVDLEQKVEFLSALVAAHAGEKEQFAVRFASLENILETTRKCRDNLKLEKEQILQQQSDLSNCIENLEHKCTASEKQNTTYRLQGENGADLILRLRAQCDISDTEVITVQAQCDELSQCSVIAAEKLFIAQNELLVQQRLVEQQYDIIDDAKAIAAARLVKLTDSQDDLVSQRKEIAMLQQERLAASAALQFVSSQSGHVDDLRMELADANMLILRLNCESSEKLGALQNEITLSEAASAEQLRCTELAHQVNSDLQNRLDRSLQQINEAEQLALVVRQEYLSSFNKQQDQCNELMLSVEELRSEVRGGVLQAQHLSSENETLRECVLEQQNVTELAHVDHQSQLNHAQTEFEDRTKQVREDLADADEQLSVQRHQLDAQIMELGCVRDRIAALQNGVTVVTAAQTEAVRRHAEDSLAMANMLSDSRISGAGAAAACYMLQQQLAESLAEHARLVSEIRDQGERKADLEKQVTQKDSELAIMMDEKCALQNKLEKTVEQTRELMLYTTRLEQQTSAEAAQLSAELADIKQRSKHAFVQISEQLAEATQTAAKHSETVLLLRSTMTTIELTALEDTAKLRQRDEHVQQLQGELERLENMVHVCEHESTTKLEAMADLLAGERNVCSLLNAELKILSGTAQEREMESQSIVIRLESSLSEAMLCVEHNQSQYHETKLQLEECRACNNRLTTEIAEAYEAVQIEKMNVRAQTDSIKTADTAHLISMAQLKATSENVTELEQELQSVHVTLNEAVSRLDQQNAEFSELRLQLDTSKVECHTAVSRVSELEDKLSQTLTLKHDQQATEADLLRERDRNDALVQQIAEAAKHIELHEMNIAQMIVQIENVDALLYVEKIKNDEYLHSKMTDAIVHTGIEAQLKSAREQLLELEQDLSLVKAKAIEDASSLAIQNAELSASCLQLNTAMSRASDLEGELSQRLAQSEHTLSLKQHQYEQNISMLQGDCEAVRSKLSLVIERVEVADASLFNVLAKEKAAVERCEQLDAQIRDLTEKHDLSSNAAVLALDHLSQEQEIAKNRSIIYRQTEEQLDRASCRIVELEEELKLSHSVVCEVSEQLTFSKTKFDAKVQSENQQLNCDQKLGTLSEELQEKNKDLEILTMRYSSLTSKYNKLQSNTKGLEARARIYQTKYTSLMQQNESVASIQKPNIGTEEC